MSVEAYIATMSREWTLPDNMRMEWEADYDIGAVSIIVIAMWDDVYDKHDKVMTSSRRHVPIGLIETNAAQALDMGEKEAMTAISELWMHELHERVKHCGAYIVHPHPTGKSSFV